MYIILFYEMQVNIQEVIIMRNLKPEKLIVNSEDVIFTLQKLSAKN